MTWDFGGLDLSGDQIDAMRAAARDADIAAARAFGFGGESWWVDRATPTGTTGPRTPVRLPDTIAALAYRQQPSVLAGTTAGQPVGNEIWRAIILELSANVQVGDTLVSENPSGQYRIQIDAIEPWYEHRRAEVSIVRHRSAA